MASDTPEAMAKQEVLALLPADTRSTGSGALLHSREDPEDTCLAWNLQSATIAHVLGEKDPGRDEPSSGDIAGTVGVVLYTVGGLGVASYDPHKVVQASVTIGKADDCGD